MPNVRGKQFGYGPKGKKAARKYARKHGLKVKHKDNPGYYAESKTEMNSYERIFNVLVEGVSTGGDPTLTGVRVGAAMAKLKAKLSPEKYRKKQDQTRRIINKVSMRANKTDPLPGGVHNYPAWEAARTKIKSGYDFGKKQQGKP